jgi:hydrogenase nickel incorporation protein HypA/HybF
MHELSVTQSILEIALRHAEKAGAKKILQLNLTIGQLSSIVDDSVQFYWDIVSEDTIAKGAKLNFKRIPAVLQCLECNHRYAPTDEELACPTCNSTQIKVVSGQEFLLESIDVE